MEMTIDSLECRKFAIQLIVTQPAYKRKTGDGSRWHAFAEKLDGWLAYAMEENDPIATDTVRKVIQGMIPDQLDDMAQLAIVAFALGQVEMLEVQQGTAMHRA